jgi:hypothetical protein
MRGVVLRRNYVHAQQPAPQYAKLPLRDTANIDRDAKGKRVVYDCVVRTFVYNRAAHVCHTRSCECSRARAAKSVRALHEEQRCGCAVYMHSVRLLSGRLQWRPRSRIAMRSCGRASRFVLIVVVLSLIASLLQCVLELQEENSAQLKKSASERPAASNSDRSAHTAAASSTTTAAGDLSADTMKRGKVCQRCLTEKVAILCVHVRAGECDSMRLCVLE